MKTGNSKTELRARRHKKIRSQVSGTAERPRLAVYKSNRYLYAQVIDDVLGKTLAQASDMTLKGKTKTDKAKQVGVEIAKNALSKKISKVVFDRGGFNYTGRIKALAEAAREGGLQF
ncbi:MAG: 50S ribosomal protein L18 [Parcubacteria group bacterium LiPW_30]|jgi:large subunit ribosomal protein L18|nr:MAG: 50S ribosomal protein L18 [Parcubacteria group bacterium LiPW_30]